MAHGNNLFAHLMKATQSPAATLVLARLLYWYKNGKGRQIEGQKWIPNSIADWCKETGMSVQQVRTALKVIETANLAEVKVAIYDTRQTLHVRPTQRAIAISEGNSDELVSQDPCCEQHAPLLAAASDQVTDNKPDCHQQHGYIQGDKQGENKEVNTGGTVSPQKESLPPTDEEPVKMKMADVEKSVKANALLHQPDSYGALEKKWINAVYEAQGSMVVLKAKEKGQLKMLHKLWASPDATLAFVLKHWTSFAAKVATDAGEKNTPAQPALGFLLKHASIAAIFAEPTPAYVQKFKGPPKPATVVQSIAPDDAEKPLTFEETLALLKGD